VIPSVAYTDPEIAWAGVTEEEARKQGVKVKVGKLPWSASGRAIANGRDEGFSKLLFDEATHRIVGGGIVGTHAGDLISEVALAIEMGADAVDIGDDSPTSDPRESVGLAAEVAGGVCTDVPPARPAMPILDVESSGTSRGRPADREARRPHRTIGRHRARRAAGPALGQAAASVSVALTRKTAATTALPVFVTILVRTREPSVWRPGLR
jgi:hypothetical protein